MATDTLSTAAWWWRVIVQPNYEEHKDHPTCVRKAFNAIISMHHMWDRLYWRNVERAGMSFDDPKADNKESQQGFRGLLKDMWRQSGIEGEMNALRICANASKHSVNVQNKQVNTATGIHERLCIADKDASAILSVAHEFWAQNLTKVENLPIADFKKAIGLVPAP